MKKFQIFFLLVSFLRKITFGGYTHCFEKFHDWVSIKDFCQAKGPEGRTMFLISTEGEGDLQSP